LIFIRLVQIHFSLEKITNVLKEIEDEIWKLKGSVEELKESQKGFSLSPWPVNHRKRRRIL
jgi:Txe/YoeB family toxin of Txe-Axe toxin-antitoxin module